MVELTLIIYLIQISNVLVFQHINIKIIEIFYIIFFILSLQNPLYVLCL